MMKSQTIDISLETIEIQKELLARLRRVEGQVGGIQRMVAEGRECTEILQQMSAARAALQQISLLIARRYLANQLAARDGDNCEVALDRLMAALARLE